MLRFALLISLRQYIKCMFSFFPKPQSVSEFMLYLLGALIALSFLKILVIGDDQNNTSQKLIGGLSVFIVAVIAESALVFSLSIFVGGLIIASEDFMKFLAAIIKSASEKIPETIQAFDIEPANKEEVAEKIKEESQELVSKTIPSDKSAQDPRGGRMDIKNRISKVRSVEKTVVGYLESIYGNDYSSNMKLQGKYGNIILDGVLRCPHGKIARIIEVKYFLATRHEEPRAMHATRRFLERLRANGINAPATLVMVFEKDVEEDKMRNLKSFLEKRFHQEDIEFALFKLNDQGGILPVSTPSTFYSRNRLGKIRR